MARANNFYKRNEKREEEKNPTNTLIINIGLTFYTIIDRSAQERRPTGIHIVNLLGRVLN